MPAYKFTNLPASTAVTVYSQTFSPTLNSWVLGSGVSTGTTLADGSYTATLALGDYKALAVDGRGYTRTSSGEAQSTSGATPGDAVEAESGALVAANGTYLPKAVTTLLMSTFDTNPAATDHTAAFNAALTAAKAVITAGQAKCQILLDSRAVYTLGGALVEGANGEHAQVPLPFSTTVSGTIEIVGRPGASGPYVGLGQSSTVIKSTLAAGSVPAYTYAGSGAGVGLASVFGGPSSYVHPFRGFGSFNYIHYSFRNVTIRSAAPVVCGIDAGYLNGFYFDDLTFDTDQTANFPGGAAFTSADLTICTALQAIPIVFPLYQSHFGALGGKVGTIGWATGPVIGELFNAQEVLTAFTPGAALNVDVAAHDSYIGMLKDWNNAYGIAAYYPQATYGTVLPGVTGAVTQTTFGGAVASPLTIGSWDMQRDNGGSDVLLNRVSDLHDGNNVCYVDAVITHSNFAAGDPNVPGGYLMMGAGSSYTGALNARIKEKVSKTGPQTPPAVPASTVAIRNPFFRDALVNVIGGVVTVIVVNGVTVTGQTSGLVLVPACASLSITYSQAPTWVWQTF